MPRRVAMWVEESDSEAKRGKQGSGEVEGQASSCVARLNVVRAATSPVDGRGADAGRLNLERARRGSTRLWPSQHR